MRVYLSSVMSNVRDTNIKQELYDDIIYILEAFHPGSNKLKAPPKNCKDLLIDSGAFEVIHKFRRGVKLKMNWEKYAYEYAQFIKKYNIKNYFELDVDCVTSYPYVLKLRKILEKETGRKCIPVWHESRGLEEYHKMCQEYSFVAVGTSNSQKRKLESLKVLVKVAHQYKAHIHGLGFTKTSVLKEIQFDSVDSSSWSSGSRYGNIYTFNGKCLDLTSVAAQMKRYRKPGPEYIQQLNMHNMKEWIKAQKYFDKVHPIF